MSFLFYSLPSKKYPEIFRTGILAGFIIYSLFAVLDYYMLPANYLAAWKIRFFIVGPSLIIPFFLSYFKQIHKHLNLLTTLVISIAQFGIFAMIYIAQSFENAYYDYFSGLILVILWAAFIFKMRLKPLIVLVLSTWIVYFYIAVYHQQLASFGINTPQFSSLLNNLMFIFTMTSLALFGNYMIDQYYSQLTEEKKNLELALKKVRESVEMKADFLNTMSHEIRTPLNGIIGFSEILKEDYKDDQEIKEMSSAINRQGNQLFNIVNSILHYTEIHNVSDLGPKDKISCNNYFNIIKRDFEFSQNKFNKYEHQLLFDCDKQLFDQHFYTYLPTLNDLHNELLDNAIKFSEGGDITVSLSTSNTSDLVLSVKDEGIGIDQNLASEIFNNFYQIESGHNRSYEGIGMGLAFAKKVVLLMNGNIWAENNVDGGAIFYVHIPNCIRPV